MCRHRGRVFPPDAGSARGARDFLAGTLREWTVSVPNDVATLLLSELVTNAVVHAQSQLEVTVTVGRGDLEVAVGDQDVRPPSRRAAVVGAADGLAANGAGGSTPLSLEAEGGRGIYLVDALADEWGVVHLSGGKQVWFRIDVGQQWPNLADCVCGTTHDAGPEIELPSGRRVTKMTHP